MDFTDINLRRRHEFEDTLLELLQEMPYENITVKDLAERRHFVRKTFYHYFPSKQACLESLTDRMILECNISALQLLPQDATLLQGYRQRLQYWIDHRDFLEAILRNKLDAFFLERFAVYIRNEEQAVQQGLQTDAVACDEDILFFYTFGQILLLLKWCNDGFVLSVEEMAQKYFRLLHEPLLPPEIQ